MILRRFILLPTLLDILETNVITFSNPIYWEDKNDSEILQSYKRKKHLKTLFALCFTKDTETIYQWKAFSDNASGCYIKVSLDKLISIIGKTKNIRHGEVKYIQIAELKKKLSKIDQIPFSKRYPYRNEAEYRFIYESTNSEKSFSLNLLPEDIISITFNQKMNDHTFESIKTLMKEKYKVSRVYRTTIYKNDKWLNYINGICT
ncbi:MAG: hypothetical protein AMQ22_01560 [Candidatus Methanofastidiosum methylothiophilum]|jgi:hypothetical protein|uniref:DUF2971 domain-containing protein n=1 Tax=Candidatus Methanofastidiosum methylothiophilum TaxID=1705564 RepID=A0A150IY52_9EURY|nr:MAG: hypothetical protein AMQ22_01560 [Candidatus Methanofastidiosum methylthiophilus]